MKKRSPLHKKNGQSYVGIGKLILWILVVAVVFLLKLCGFDVQYPTVTP